MEDTAVIPVADTAVEPEQPTSPSVEPEAVVEVESPEIVSDSEEAPETEPEWQPPATPEELEALLEQKAKDADARARESERRKYEAQQAKDLEAAQMEAYKRDQERAAEVRRTGVQTQLQSLVDGLLQYMQNEVSENGELPKNVAINPQWLAYFFDNVDGPLYQSHYEARKRGHDAWIRNNYPEYRASEDILSQRERAYATRDWGKVAESEYKMMEEVITQKLSPALRQRVEQELAEESQAKQAEEATTQRQRAPKPTQVGGGPPAKTNWDAVLSSPTATKAEKDRAFRELHGFDPD